jgi:hypothetical protein
MIVVLANQSRVLMCGCDEVEVALLCLSILLPKKI